MPSSFVGCGSIDANEHFQHETKRKAHKIIALSSMILVAGICLVVGNTRGTKNTAQFHAHTKSSVGSDAIVKAFCYHTLYPEVCSQQISSYQGSITANPLQLVAIAVKVTLAHVNNAHSLANNCSVEKGLYVVESVCTKDCLELMESTQNQLNAAISRLSSLTSLVNDSASLKTSLRDVKVWLSSSLSYQTACSDGFQVAPGSIQERIQSNQEFVSGVIVNSLCLVNTLSELGNDLSSWTKMSLSVPKKPHLRRLLTHESSFNGDVAGLGTGSFSSGASSDAGFPDWVSPVVRQLLQVPTGSVTADVTVAQDGTGDYEKIKDALDNIPSDYEGRYVIYIKKGVYEEVFNVTNDLVDVTFLGDGIGNTVITGDRNVASGQYTTYRSSTVGIAAEGFLARDITFRNTAGPGGHQAVALRAGADFLVFDSCSFEGYQDTLYALSSRQFYRGCKIYGTVDFIFGNAIAVFQNCEVIARQPMEGQQNTYTAQGRTVSADVSGFSFQNCTFTADASLQNSAYQVSTYLGRPWKEYSRTVFLQSYMDSLIDPEGWLPWNASNPFTDTVYYGEYENRGPGSNTDQRVDWKGVHPNMAISEATEFTVENFISGTTWLSSFQVDYTSGL